MTYRHHFFSLSMLIMLAFVAWTFFSFQSQHPNLNTTVALPDVLMEDVIALIMDKQGKPSLKIISPKMIHFAHEDATHLLEPHLTIYRNAMQPWFITAKSGRATKGVEHVKFWDEVTVQHAADIHSPPTMIKTSSLLVHPNDQIAETEEAITLTQPNITVNATGMHADISSGDVKLLSQARGVYAPR